MLRHRRPSARVRWPRFLRWGAALAVLGLLVFGAAELLLRSFPQSLPPASQFRLHDNAIQANPINSLPDEEFGYLWRPHLRARMAGLNFAFDYSTDGHGFRNPGPWPERAEVVVLGDSQAFAFGVGDHEAWARQLAERLPERTLVNLGLVGAAPQQFERIYQAYGRPLRPRVVLVGLFPPLSIEMARMFDRWVAEGRPDRFDIRRLHGGGERDLLGRIKGGLKDSYAVLGLWYGLKGALGASDLRTMTFEDGRVRLVSSRYGDTAAAVATRRPDFLRVVEVLEQLQAMVRADGARMMVVPFPTKEEIHLPLLGERPHEVTTPFRHALEQRGISTIDLERPLQEGVAAGQHLFFEIDLHPDPAGQRVVAEVVAEALRQRFGGRALEALRPPRPERRLFPDHAVARSAAGGSGLAGGGRRGQAGGVRS